VAATEPSNWEATGSRPEKGQTEKVQLEKSPAVRAAGTSKRAAKGTGAANVVVSNTGYRERRCRFHRYIGCTEDHTAAA
jgi:hypothetical protein